MRYDSVHMRSEETPGGVYLKSGESLRHSSKSSRGSMLLSAGHAVNKVCWKLHMLTFSTFISALSFHPALQSACRP